MSVTGRSNSSDSILSLENERIPWTPNFVKVVITKNSGKAMSDLVSTTDDLIDTSPKISAVNVESSSSASTDDQLRGYALFLDKLKDPSCAQLVSRVKLFVSRFPMTLNREQAAERLHVFIGKLEDELVNIEAFADGKDEEYLNTKEGLEKLVLKPLHQHFFTMEPRDKQIDEALSSKITRIAPLISLHTHLHGPEEFKDDSLLDLAFAEFQRIDSYRAPRDKLQCILNGFRVIRHALDTVIGPSKWGADQLLPLCIYSIIRANPPSLQSNVHFITYFRHPSRIRGEDEYLLMQMDIAIRDIMNIDEILLKPPLELTIGDIVTMYQKFQKCLTEMVVSPSSSSEDFSKWRETEWKITDIKNFIHAYSSVTEEYARSIGP